jgi:hypothetical protein
MRNKQLEAIANDIMRTLRDIAEDEELFFCPSTPDKCKGCEVSDHAVGAIVDILKDAQEAEEARREFSY